MGVALELLKSFIIKELKMKHKVVITIVFSLLYLASATISGVASYGSVKLTLNMQERLIYLQKI
jgi:hypothetical protein